MIITLTAIENITRGKIWQGSGEEDGIGGLELISLIWDYFRQQHWLTCTYVSSLVLLLIVNSEYSQYIPRFGKEYLRNKCDVFVLCFAVFSPSHLLNVS